MDQFLTDLSQTICAISTPHGAGGIAVIRISGNDSLHIVNKIWKGTDLENVGSHTAHLGRIIDPDTDEVIDECVATIFRGPHSYTGEDTVEISVHGSRWIQRETIALLTRQGARIASRGEFTRRALANGRIDLSQAEGVADLIASSSRAAHRIALKQMKGSVTQSLDLLRDKLLRLASLIELELDFSEEDVEFVDRTQLSGLTSQIKDEVDRLRLTYSRGNAIKEGLPVAIVGPTNAGKSTLLNQLIGDNRAIVSDIHGTTRDTIEETLEIGDYLFRFIDTAGLRETSDPIERIGITRSRQAIESATVIILALDSADIPNVISFLSAKNQANSCSESSRVKRQTESEGNNHIDEVLNYNIHQLINTYLSSPLSPEQHLIVALNKMDIPLATEFKPFAHEEKRGDISKDFTNILCHIPDENIDVIALSAKNGQGISSLLERLQSIATEIDSDQLLISSQRQAQSLADAAQSLEVLLNGLADPSMPTDILAFYLRQTLQHLTSVTSPITTPEILNSIFQSFCIGK